MNTKKLRASSRNSKIFEETTPYYLYIKIQNRSRKRSAQRAEDLLAFYHDINPDLERRTILGSLLYDLMHLCDKSPTLESLEQGYDNAVASHRDDLIQDAIWLRNEIGRLDRLRKADRR